eukprot:scaffold5374_cov149-Skeletonema_menzelii.AAC.4
MGSSDKRRRHRSKEDRRRESSSPHHEEGRGRSGDNKLTEEEQRLYDKARAYVEKEDKSRHSSSRRRERHRPDSSEDDDRHKKSSSRRNKGRKRKSSDKYNSSDNDNDSDVSSRRDRKRHRSSSHRDRKKKYRKQRRSRDRDDLHEKSHEKKKSRHRSHDDDDDEDKHSKRSSKRHKNSKHHDDTFRQKAAKHSNTSKLVSLGEIVSEPPQELLDTDTNYFSHNSHLRLYLYRHYGIYFEDLTSEESHDAFKEFVSKYNDGKLETAYYEIKGKLPQEALDQCQRTQHKWNFKTNKVEMQSLKIVRDGVKKQTEYDADDIDKGGVMQRTQTATAVAAAPGPKSAIQSDEQNNKLTYDERRRVDKRHRERIKVGNEEMFGTGKADFGRDRMIEKRREQANKIHGAARDRESEAGAELDDKAIYGGEGGGDISYEAALAREKKFRERKEAAKHERNSELLKKEEDKQKKMLEMLGISGLKPGEKIKIAPRQP